MRRTLRHRGRIGGIVEHGTSLRPLIAVGLSRLPDGCDTSPPHRFSPASPEVASHNALASAMCAMVATDRLGGRDVSWLNLLTVAAWGMLVAQFCIQACLFLVLFVFALIGVLKGNEKMPRSNNVAAMAASLGGVVVFTFLFFVGSWIIDYLQLDPSRPATIVFWVCVAFSAVYVAPQLPMKLKNGWRDAVHQDAMLRTAFENAKNWPPKRPPEMTPANYRVVYSDGVSQDRAFLPKEIDDWATLSNQDAEGKFPNRVVRIIDTNGNTVWGK
jgi:hypothetical protein